MHADSHPPNYPSSPHQQSHPCQSPHAEPARPYFHPRTFARRSRTLLDLQRVGDLLILDVAPIDVDPVRVARTVVLQVISECLSDLVPTDSRDHVHPFPKMSLTRDRNSNDWTYEALYISYMQPVHEAEVKTLDWYCERLDPEMRSLKKAFEFAVSDELRVAGKHRSAVPLLRQVSNRPAGVAIDHLQVHRASQRPITGGIILQDRVQHLYQLGIAAPSARPGELRLGITDIRARTLSCRTRRGEVRAELTGEAGARVRAVADHEFGQRA